MRILCAIGAVAVFASQSLAQSPSLIESFMDMDEEAREELLAGMKSGELNTFHHDLRMAVQEAHRNRIGVERNLLEFEKLTRAARIHEVPGDARVREFLGLAGQPDALDRFARSMTANEYREFRSSFKQSLEQRQAIAQKLEVNAMREEILVKELSFSPLVEANDRRCDPGSFCRLGCRGRAATCDRITNDVGLDCYDLSTTRYEECMIDVDSPDDRDAQTEYCNSGDAANLAFCESQYADNGEACGTASMECNNCCAQLPGDMFITFQHCFRPFETVSVSTHMPPELSEYP